MSTYRRQRDRPLSTCSRRSEVALGTLDDVEKVIRLFGVVNADPDFAEHTRVVDAASELLVTVFGDDVGCRARLAVGVSSLPADLAPEVEATVRVISH